MSRPIEDYPPYERLTPDERYGELRKIEYFLRKYATADKINFDRIVCRKEILLDIIERVEKRRVYFQVFHKIEMSEKKEASLYCFWIVKLAPFFYAKRPEYQINVIFAAYLFVSAINQISSRSVHRINPEVAY